MALDFNVFVCSQSITLIKKKRITLVSTVYILFSYFLGLRAIGFNMVASLIMAILINGALSYATLPVSKCAKVGFFFSCSVSYCL